VALRISDVGKELHVIVRNENDRWPDAETDRGDLERVTRASACAPIVIPNSHRPSINLSLLYGGVRAKSSIRASNLVVAQTALGA
jgi:hypothetical protein